MRMRELSSVLLAALTCVAVACGGAPSPTSSGSAGGPLSAAQLKGRSLVFEDYGGALTAADKKYFGDPFAQKFGVNVTFADVPSPPTTVTQQEQSGSVQMDVLFANYTNYKNGDIQKLPTWLQNDAKAVVADPSVDVSDHWIGGWGNTAEIIACNPDIIQKCPTNAKEFWDVKDFPGPRAMVGSQPPDSALLFAEMAMGIPHDKLYPIDITKAVNKLKEIKPYITVWPTSGGQMQQVLIDKEVGIEYGWNGRLFTVQRDNIPHLKLYWDDSSVSSPMGGGISVARGAPDADVAFTFIDWCLQQVDLETQWVEAITYPAPNKKVDANLPPNIRAAVPFSPSHAKEVLQDAKWTYENQVQERQAFQQMLTGTG